jgi:xanthine dehydrogenase large subunit
VPLGAQGHFATPGLAYDRAAERGEPFAYHVYGCARVDVTVDALLGTCTVDAVHAVHDAGIPLDEGIDRGQAEGAIVQGIGWMTMEELRFGADGRLATDTLSTYKVPDINGIPRELVVDFLPRAPHPAGLHRSKAVGEPPFMYGIGVYFAMLDAMRAFRPGLRPRFSVPLTPETLLLALHGAADPGPDHRQDSDA